MDNFDEVKRCPDCEKPNQFGELCDPCRRSNDGYFDEDALWEQAVHNRAVAREDAMGVPEDQR